MKDTVIKEILERVLKQYLQDNEPVDNYMISTNNSMLEQILSTAIEIYGIESVLFSLKWGHEVESVVCDIFVTEQDGKYIAISKLAIISNEYLYDWTIATEAYFILLCIWKRADVLPDTISEIKKIVNNNLKKPLCRANIPY